MGKNAKIRAAVRHARAVARAEHVGEDGTLTPEQAKMLVPESTWIEGGFSYGTTKAIIARALGIGRRPGQVVGIGRNDVRHSAQRATAERVEPAAPERSVIEVEPEGVSKFGMVHVLAMAQPDAPGEQ